MCTSRLLTLTERRFAIYFYVIFVSLLMASQSADAQRVSAPYQLNADLQALGDVVGTALSADGRYLVYVSDQIVNQRFEMFSVPIEGGTATRLNMPFTEEGSGISSFKISPDSRRVVYRADSVSNNTFEIFSVPIEGGESIRLNADLVSGGDVSTIFEISSDSTTVVYEADQIINDQVEIFTVPIDGGFAQRLNLGLPVGADVSDFKISADGTRVVYVADQNFLSINQLFSVPITSFGQRSLIEGADRLTEFEITPDSNHVVFIHPNGAGGVRIRSAPIEGGASISLYAAAPVFSVVTSFAISPDSSRVVYLADQAIGGVFELFSVSIDGVERTRLNEDLAVSGEEFVGDVEEYFDISSDSQGVIYLADQSVDNVRELYYVGIDGGSVTRLNADLPPGGDVLEQSFKFTPNSQHVVYQAEQNLNDINEIFSVSVSGGSPIRLNGNSPALSDGVGFGFQIAPDSSFVVYRAQQNTAEVDELYLAPINGGFSKRLNSNLPSGADVGGSYRISSNSRNIIYRADQDVLDEIEVFGIAILEEELCVPIKALNGNFAVICL